MMASQTSDLQSKGKQPSQEQIANGFNDLRNQQRQLASKISEISDEKKEYQLVHETLKEMEKERTCYRMVGGVLIQKNVGEVMPTLEHSLEQMTRLLATLEKQLEDKGKALIDYKEKYNVRLQNEGAPAIKQGSGDEKSAQEDSSKSTGVLVGS